MSKKSATAKLPPPPPSVFELANGLPPLILKADFDAKMRFVFDGTNYNYYKDHIFEWLSDSVFPLGWVTLWQVVAITTNTVVWDWDLAATYRAMRIADQKPVVEYKK